MALKDIALSSGSACTSASLEPSYVLRALGAAEDMAHSSLRFGLGRFTTEAEIDFVVEKLVATVQKLRDMRSVFVLVLRRREADRFFSVPSGRWCRRVSISTPLIGLNTERNLLIIDTIMISAYSTTCYTTRNLWKMFILRARTNRGLPCLVGSEILNSDPLTLLSNSHLHLVSAWPAGCILVVCQTPNSAARGSLKLIVNFQVCPWTLALTTSQNFSTVMAALLMFVS
jgi:hypothetical protein